MEQHGRVEIRFRLNAMSRPAAPSAVETELPAAGRLPRVTQVLALAIQFQDMIRLGEARDYADLARLGGLTRERVSQIVKLVWLAPDIQIEILHLPPVSNGHFLIRERAVRNISSTICWVEQHREWDKLKELNHLA
jgi:hypothetical protein